MRETPSKVPCKISGGKVKEILKQWRGYFGELHPEPETKDDIPGFVEECKFTWEMRYAAGEFDEFVYIEGLGALEELENLVITAQ